MRLPAVLAPAIAALVLAAPASAAGPVTSVLTTVAKAATPTVTEAVSAAAPVTPSPAAAQQAGDVAPRPAPLDRTVGHTTSPPATSSVSTVVSELPAAHHDQSSAGTPPGRPGSAPPAGERLHAPGSTPPRAAGSGDSAGAASSTASPQHLSGPVDGAAQGVAPAKQVTTGASQQTGLLPARSGERLPRPSRLVDAATAGAPVHAVQRLVPASGLLEASRALGDVSATATLVETTPATIAPLLAPLARTLTLPSLPELAALPELASLLTLPSLPTLPVLPTLPSLLAPPEQSPGPAPALSPLPAPSAPPQPSAPSPPSAAAHGGGADASSAAAPQGAWQASGAVQAQAYATTADGVGGTMGAPDRRGSTRSAVGALESAAWAAGAMTSAYELRASDGTAPAAPGAPSPRGGAYQQPSPAPAPGGASPATGAVAGTSIPIFLTLAGLLLLAAPRVRRVLRLLAESWRLSPLALIPERPG
ncbi:MAG TPA: hypothetical protein VLJ80_04780 [Solirubrobacteraceae bacterium]|nr:hypothetical protein [Solirubrobacteraceae bacterium]